MYVVMEENYAGMYVVGRTGNEDVYNDRASARRARDGHQIAADSAGIPTVFRLYELWEVEEI